MPTFIQIVTKLKSRWLLSEINKMKFPTQFFAYYNSLVQEERIQRAELIESFRVASNGDNDTLKQILEALRSK